jgi:uncharacterized membrane-anchored protein YitT (DUF2179 family)
MSAPIDHHTGFEDLRALLIGTLFISLAVMGGLLMGAGFLMLFRHHASLGGVGIVALALQQQRGWRAGKVQMAVDCAIVLAALFVVEPARIGYSLVGAVVLNLTLAVNHKPGRYIAM